MTSQKRYRQHQESSNSARFRDLPPRFKRQKSSTSPVPPSVPAATSLESQSSNTVNHSAITKRTDSQQFVKSPVTMAPSFSDVYPLEQNLCAQVRTHVLTAPQTSNAAAWQIPQKINGAFVLSSWNNRQYDQRNNTESHHVPLGTHFGYKPDSPPLSPWSSTGASNFSGQSSDSVNSTWMLAHSDQRTSQRIPSPSGYFNNENWAPTQIHRSSDTVWSKSSSSSQQSSNSSSPPPPIPSHLSLPTKPSEKTKCSGEKQTNGKQVIDYSDPDIRTIEMLRELERVADEKESECNDFGVDRKSLVSHHLRMLMCAVDRYTEGIEDDIAVASRCDEVTNDSRLSTPRGSPGPIEVWSQRQVKETTMEAKSKLDTSQWSSDLKTPVWKDSMVAQMSPASGHLSVPAQGHKALFPLPIWEKPKGMKSQESASWDLWSSPSFDFSGVLTCQNTEDLTRDPFGRFREKDERERKPLYQR